MRHTGDWVLLAGLSTPDGLHPLDKSQWDIGFRAAAIALYLLVTIRVLQFMVIRAAVGIGRSPPRLPRLCRGVRQKWQGELIHATRQAGERAAGLVTSFDPGDNLWPNANVGLATDQHTQMLQPDTDFVWAGNNLDVFGRHLVDKRRNRD